MIAALTTKALSAYALTFIVTSSAIFEPLRKWAMAKTPRLKIGNHKHMAECRMCMGFYAALIVCNTDWQMILPVYGLSYFLATQEH